MRNKKALCLIPLLFAASVTSLCVAEEEMDVDQADSLNFEAFHTDKKAAIKLWEKQDVEKAYEKEKSDTTVGKESTSSQATADKPAPAPAADRKGKRYEIRELYSLTGSERTGYNPATVVQALYLQMQGYCPNGWRKLDERSEPDGSDAFYMYYAFECL